MWCSCPAPSDGNLRDNRGPELSPTETYIFLHMYTYPPVFGILLATPANLCSPAIGFLLFLLGASPPIRTACRRSLCWCSWLPLVTDENYPAFTFPLGFSPHYIQLPASGRLILCYRGPSRPSPGHHSQCLHIALSSKVWALSNSSCTFLACSKAVPSLLVLCCPTFLVGTLSGTATVSCYKGRKRSAFLPADSVCGVALPGFILRIARSKFYHLW